MIWFFFADLEAFIAAFKAGDKAYIVESNRIVRECTIKRVTGNLVVIRFKNGGGKQVSNKRLYDIKEAAEESVQEMKSTVQKIPEQQGYQSPYDYWY